jgi:hypothetical protein
MVTQNALLKTDLMKDYMKKIFITIVMGALSYTLVYPTHNHQGGFVTQQQQVLNYNFQITAPTVDQMKGALGNMIEKPLETVEQWHTWILNNKIQAAAYALGISYVCYNAYLAYLQYRLQATDNWSLWNNQTSYEELQATPPHALAETLLQELQQRYTTAQSIENFSEPLVIFFKAIETEEYLLKAYYRLATWSKNTGIGKFMWIDDQLYTDCHIRLKKLTLLKSIFVQWISDLRINRSTTPKHSYIIKK